MWPLKKTFVLSLLLLSFCILSGFEPVLHTHEFSPGQDTEGCVACQWFQTGMEPEPPAHPATVHAPVVQPVFQSIVRLQESRLTPNTGLSPPDPS